jgi:hypothetical protein
MPRRTVSRCSPKSLGATGPKITTDIEWNLIAGDCFGFLDLHTREEFAEPWKRWGAEITKRWIEAFPGSRPAACYILGEIPAPTWTHPTPGLRHPLRSTIKGVTLAWDTAGHKQEPELDHLLDLGLVSDEELEAAEKRLAEADATYHGRYRYLYKDQG